MSLLDRIDQDLIKALKSGEKDATVTLRGLKSDIKYFKINNTLKEVTDDDIIKVMAQAAKQRRDSIEKFEQGGREDLVAKEKAELEIIARYLPAGLKPEELAAIVDEVVAEVGASSPADMGKVMKAVMPKVQGRADGKAVKDAVMARLKG
ncbi:MAG: GatB/YqeY domain-containing protein [Candidatus Zixiibacteriota bacterium]